MQFESKRDAQERGVGANLIVNWLEAAEGWCRARTAAAGADASAAKTDALFS
jgi:hypothetical protein